MQLLSTNSFSGNVGLKITQIKYMFCGYSKENDCTQCILNMSNQLCNSLEFQKLGARGYNLCLKSIGNLSTNALWLYPSILSSLTHLLFLYKTLKPLSSAVNFSSVETKDNMIIALKEYRKPQYQCFYYYILAYYPCWLIFYYFTNY